MGVIGGVEWENVLLWVLVKNVLLWVWVLDWLILVSLVTVKERLWSEVNLLV